MREIKFRVWDKHEKKMGKVTGIKFSDVQHTLVHYRYVDDRGRVIDEQSHVDDKGHGVVVLVQYTGLKDKNGKEIYEGDIILIGNEKAWVTFDDGCFCVCGYLGDGRTYPLRTFVFSGKKIEVISNIYQNPELLGDHDESK